LCLDELKTFFSAIDRDTCKDREGWLCKRAWCNFSERGYKRETTRYYLSLVRDGIPVNSTALQRRLGFFLAVRLSGYCLAIEWYLVVGQLCVTLLCMGLLRLGGLSIGSGDADDCASHISNLSSAHTREWKICQFALSFSGAGLPSHLPS
jgi:hypothetical protein